MWSRLSHIILKFRLFLMLLIVAITAVMGYFGSFNELSYDLANVVPEEDTDMQYLIEFKELFGEDGNIVALGIKDSSVYSIEQFERFKLLSDELTRLPGVNSVLGLPSLQVLTPNRQKQEFELRPLFAESPENQTHLDSLLSVAKSLRFYSGQIINEQNGSTIILVSLDKEVINSSGRNELVFDIVKAGQQFENVSGIDVKFAGLPYVRSSNMVKIKAELNKFLIYSMIITGIILLLFFRSLKAVLFPLIIIGIVVVWVMGTVVLLGYKITILTGLIPSIIVVIGIPNSVYMLNKYHQEYNKHGDKQRALHSIIKKIGIVTLITNFTTAVGFAVLVFTQTTILMEFGIVASLNVMATFIVSIIMIPALYAYLEPPSSRHLKHLDIPVLRWILDYLDRIVSGNRVLIFVVTVVVVVIASYGVTKINAVSYMVDDLPQKSELRQDLGFFEENFSGIMPLEIVIDTGSKKGVQNINNLRQIDRFEKFLDSVDYISQPISVVTFIKAARQAYYNQSPAFYGMPSQRDLGFILRYINLDRDQDLTKSFVDSTGQKMRMSLKVADIGSNKMDSLVNGVIQPKMDEYFGKTKMEATITGTTLLFIKGNKFLVDNLLTSMMIAFLIIAIIMALLFRNFKMIVISLIPNVIPLLMTAGLMGHFGIPLKPSTALTFGIAFGISVDYSIHFLAKYRLELFATKFNVPLAVSKSLRETGVSMIYTSIILFFGFVIFAASEFGGTVALGKLISLTLLFAMLTNVIVLPALLLQFDSGKRDKNIHPLIEKYPEFRDNKESGTETEKEELT